MQRLILLRHAQAERASPTGEDFDRPLTSRGREDALLIGRMLAEAGFRPDLALVSAARRTIQTWEAAATAFPQARVELVRNLFEADAQTLMQNAGAAAERAETVMLVAHNPALQELAGQLAEDAADSRLSRGFPTAGAAVFDVEESGRHVLVAVLAADAHP